MKFILKDNTHLPSLYPDISLHNNLEVKNLMMVMEECYRLRSAPESFPSDFSRNFFFAKLSFLCKCFLSLIAARDQLSLDLTPNFHGRPLAYPKNAWNKYLNNQYNKYITPPPGAKIIYHFPESLVKMGSRTHFMYQVVERSYEQVRRQNI